MDNLTLRQKIELLIKRHATSFHPSIFFGSAKDFSTKILIKAFWKQRHCGVYFLLNIVGNKEKGRISKRVFQEKKARQIFRKKRIFFTPDTHAYVNIPEVRNVRFSENLECFAFLKHPFWDSPFCLITHDMNSFINNFHRFCHLPDNTRNLETFFPKKHPCECYCRYAVHCA